MHFHDKDTVALFLEDGDLKSTTLDGQSTVNPHTSGEVRFALRNRTHTLKRSSVGNSTQSSRN